MGKGILALLEQGWERREIIFQDDSWRDSVPAKPGWYYIETDMLPEELRGVGSPKGVCHCSIPERVRDSFVLKEFQGCILPGRSPFYIVYFGEVVNLKARSREHVSGHAKTGCLAFAQYPAVRAYKWFFCFLVAPVNGDPRACKLIRTFGEQSWRAKHGWPILCRR